MQIFLDSADEKELTHWLAEGVVDGVTTNPSILLKDGASDLESMARRLAALLGHRPLSVEVTASEPGQMIEQGRAFARWASNVVVKIPIVTQDGDSCLRAIYALSRAGIPVNATAILSFNQAVLAAKAGACYVSVFAGRVADEGHDPAQLIAGLQQWLRRWESQARVLVASIRSVMDVQRAAEAGADIITIPPAMLPKMVDHKYSRETVRQFNADAARAFTA
ncbi:MAG: transaldolase family protein, partial [Candidatus Acidiferrales bacterium]